MPSRRRIPLALRLPNGPPSFVGRDRERARLAELIERSSLAVVVGPGGIGKTSLVLNTIHELLADRRTHTFFISIPPDEPLEQLLRTVLTALAAWSRTEDSLDLAAIQTDIPLAIETLIDLAEKTKVWMVLDDVHHVIDGEIDELLSALAHHAHESRFIATSRTPPRLAPVKERSLDLGKLEASELVALARDLAEPDADGGVLHQMAQAAHGSPWLLKQVVAMGERGLDASREELLGNLSPETIRFLEALAVVRVATAPNAFGPGLPAPSNEELDRARTRGLLLESGEGFRTHDVVADLVAPAASTELGASLRREIGGLLIEAESAGLQLEGVRLLVEGGDLEASLASLSASGDEILAHGLAPRLFRIVTSVDDPRFALWQLRCAAELGNATALDAVRPPRLTSETDRLAWARASYLSGEPESAKELIGALLEDASADGEGGWLSQADLLMARCELAMGQIDDALARLQLSRDVHFPAEALCVRVEAWSGVVDAPANLDRALRSSSGQSAESLVDLAWAAFLVDRFDRADQLLAQVLATPRGGAASHYVARRGLLLQARMRVQEGKLAEADELISAVRPYVRGASVLRPELLSVDVARRIAVGELAGIRSVLDRARATLGDAVSGVWLRGLNAHLDTLRGTRVEDDEAGLFRLISAVRHGESGVRAHAETRLEGRVWTRLARALIHLTQGELGGAEAEARRAVEEAATSAQRALQAEARCVLCDVLLCDRQDEARQREAAALSALADELGSARFVAEAAFYEHVGDPATLERLASQLDVAPVAARRARALLGSTETALDTIDELVLTAAGQSWAQHELVNLTHEGATWSAGWGADSRDQSLWLADGRTVALRRKPILWAMVTTLVDKGGEASKEELVLGAWEERLYHPERHDPKLHVAVRALRKTIERDPSNPELLRTADDGYALGRPFRFLSTRESEI